MPTIDNDRLKTRVKGVATFAYFYDNALYYRTEDGFTFPVPVADTANSQGGAATFNAVEKGITLMRWIRRAMEAEMSALDALTAETERLGLYALDDEPLCMPDRR
jgi:hypothetical protein